MKIITIMGSESDKAWAEKINLELNKWGLNSEQIVASAHKVPEKVFEIVSEFNKEKDIVYITIAGRSNGLSGVTAANSIHPVIACPPFSDKTDMLVNIHSTIQMPSDTPVITILDPKNVAGAIVRIAGLTDENLQEKVKENIQSIKNAY